jgi:hypothetical protein
MFFLTTLLNEAGDLAAAEGKTGDSRTCYLKGLNLLLDSLTRGDGFEQPEFVPKVELFLSSLDELPAQTQAMLMEHYERSGQFGKAEDPLFAILDSGIDNENAINFGISFYERLRGRTDAQLAEGNLPRTEVESGLQELRGRLLKA